MLYAIINNAGWMSGFHPGSSRADVIRARKVPAGWIVAPGTRGLAREYARQRAVSGIGSTGALMGQVQLSRLAVRWSVSASEVRHV